MNSFRKNIQLRSWGKVCLFIFGLLLTQFSFAITKTAITGGNWSNPAIWSPAGIPASTDDAIIASGITVNVDSDRTIKNLNVNANGNLIWTAGRRMTITATFTVDGNANMNGGLLTIQTAGQRFVLGPSGTFTFDPGINTNIESTIFTRAVENFSPTSTLIIKRWFNYANTLGQYITGDFGNLTINTPGASNTIVEWNQKNQFQAHKILGRLTVDQGWVTLDKTGNISVTTIGSILLTGLNSTLYGHSGTHPSSFSIVTNSITNNGGNFFGLNDGNGNVTIHTLSNFTNSGNVKILNNSGVLNVSNGNATFLVDGTYTQSAGDTRVIYNVTTTNSGSYTATFGNLVLNGGIFMGQTGCNVTAATNSFTVNNNFTINFQNVTDKFRINSVSTIGSSINTSKTNFSVSGNLSITGLNNAEFTSSAAAGDEQININGALTQAGTICSFNFGAIQASHNITATIGSYTNNSGLFYFSRNNGDAQITINNRITLNGGTTVVKAGVGSVQVNCGGYVQNNGNCYLHNNTQIPSTFPININVNGNFSHAAGTIYFDDNTAVTNGISTIFLNSDSVNLTGTGVMTAPLAGTGTALGKLVFTKQGTITYNRTNGYLIEQIIQSIKNRADVNVIGSTFPVSSHVSPSIQELIVEMGGTLSLNNAQVISNLRSTNCNIQIDSLATIRTGKSQGLFDGTTNAAFNSSGNLRYTLDKNSIVEYNGFLDQQVTGLISSSGNIQKYGTLRINLRGNSNTANCAPQVFVRTGLELINGELNLNRNTVTLENGSPTAISRQNGYIKSEDNNSNNSSVLCWQNIQAGMHTIPFGIPTAYLPVQFQIYSGFGTEINASTRNCAADNQPYPVSCVYPTSAFTGTNTIDRWWVIRSQSLIIKADISLTYQNSENSMGASPANLRIVPQSATGFTNPANSAVNSGSNTTTISTFGIPMLNNYMVCDVVSAALYAPTDFNASIENNGIYLQWTTKNNIESQVQRSLDGIEFTTIGIVKNGMSKNDIVTYDFKDDLWDGRSFYRIYIVAPDGTSYTSEIRSIQSSYGSGQTVQTEIKSVGPNPFNGQLNITYTSPKPVHFFIYSQAGQVVYDRESGSENGIEEISGLDQLTPGVYFLVMQTDTEKKTKKIIKQ